MPARKLILIRHAKSCWKDESLPDLARPLNRRGLRDAPEMGRRLRERGIHPELFVTSPAVRAYETARTIAEQIGFPINAIAIEEWLYGASASDVTSLVEGLENSNAVVVVVAHNPTLTDLANQFIAEGIENVPTCGIVTIETTAWSELRDNGRLIDFDYPKRQV